MAFTITHVSGAMDRDPPVAGVRALVDELDTADREHPDVAVSHETGWTLSALAGGRVVWENVEADDEPRHLDDVPREEVVEMFEALAGGDVASVEARSWLPGNT